MQTLRILALLSGAVSLGCTGNIGGDHGSSTGGPGDTTGGGNNTGNTGATGGGGNHNPPPPDNTGSLDDSMTVPAAAPLRRLTRLEYDNTIHDLLGVTSTSSAKLSADQGSSDSGFMTGGAISGSTDARGVMNSADDVTAAALQRLPSLLPCGSIPTAQAAQDACAGQFVEAFGMRAFRRPLSPTELSDLKALYQAHRDPAIGDTFENSIGAVISAVLQTPQFLYHWEMGPDGPIKEGNLLRYGPYELASKLSYLFWATMPDDVLFQSAKDGKLNSPDDVAREAKRLLASDRAKVGLQDFFIQWLELQNLGDLAKAPNFTLFTPDLVAAMGQETRDFVNSLFFGANANGKVETLLTSSTDTIDANLAKLYGVTTFSGTGTKQVDLDPTRRAGIFTQAGFLNAKAEPDVTHPVKRGDAVLRRVLCMDLVIPADLVVPALPEPIPGQTTRERYSVHHMLPCATCHKLIDPVGFSFEHYDPIGAWRDTEQMKPIDATGTFTLQAGDISFNGAVELMKQLAKAPEASDCMATQWLRYSLRRREIASEDPSVKVLQGALSQSGDMRDAMVAATKAKTFTHRAPSPGEVTQ
jgi:hypothetical protein